MNEIIFKDLKIEHVCKPKIKHSYISIKPNATSVKVIVKTPNVSQDFIYNLLLEKEPWIRKQLLKISHNKQSPINLEDEVLLFGEVYSIDSFEAKELREKLSKIDTKNKELIAKKYDEFYKNQAKEYLTQRVHYFAQVMSLEFSEVKFRKMKSRWGSCSSRKVITLNTELIKIKKELIDYVLVHELSHLVHMNHSKAFHSFVDKYLPDAKATRKELKNIYLEK